MSWDRVSTARLRSQGLNTTKSFRSASKKTSAAPTQHQEKLPLFNEILLLYLAFYQYAPL